MSVRKLSTQAIDEIVERYRAGEPAPSLGEEFGVTSEAIYYHLRARGEPRRHPRRLTADEVDDLVFKWRRGATGVALAHEFGVGLTTVIRHVSRCTGMKGIGRQSRQSYLSLPTRQTELAYLAALIDGEGCITRNSKRHGEHTWQVVITNTSPELERWLHRIGGRFYYPRRVPSTKLPGAFRKQTFEWKVFRAWDVYRVLSAVLPYLVIKRARALQVVQEIEARFGIPRELACLTESNQQLRLA